MKENHISEEPHCIGVSGANPTELFALFCKKKIPIFYLKLGYSQAYKLFVLHNFSIWTKKIENEWKQNFHWIGSWSQFHQSFKRAFFIQKFVQSQNVTRKKTFVWKRREKNIDEIDSWWQSDKRNLVLKKKNLILKMCWWCVTSIPTVIIV